MACIMAETSKRVLKEPITIILDDLDFTWTEKEINMAIFMWTYGWSIEQMARKLRKYDGIKNAVDEVALLIMHLSRQGKIKPRKGGLFGHGQAGEKENRQDRK